MRAVRAGSLLCLVISSTCARAEYSIRFLGDLPGGSVDSAAYAISADGSTLVGVGRTSTAWRAVKWSGAGSLVPLGTLPGGWSSEARGVSADGSTVVGSRWNSSNAYVPVSWSTNENVLDATISRRVLGVNGAGTRIVGDFAGWWLWEASTFQSIPLAPRNISLDGNSIVGRSSQEAAVLFNGTLQLLGDTPGGFYSSWAIDASSDASTIVGFGDWNHGKNKALRWDQSRNMHDLGFMPSGFSAEATACSADGSVIIGVGELDGPTVPFIWTERFQMLSLTHYLAEHGVVLDGGQFWVTDISADGKKISGFKFASGNREAFLLNLDFDSRVSVRNLAVTKGELFYGSSSWLHFDDGYRVCLWPDPVSLQAEIEASTISPTQSPSSFSLQIATEVYRPGISQVVRHWNFSQNRFDVIDGRHAPVGGEIGLTFDLSNRSLALIGPNGDIRVNIGWSPINDEDPAQDGWLHCIDLLRWFID